MYQIGITAREAGILKQALLQHLYAELDGAKQATEGLTGEGVQSLVDSVRADLDLLQEMQVLLDVDGSMAPVAAAGELVVVPGPAPTEVRRDDSRAAGELSTPKVPSKAKKRKR